MRLIVVIKKLCIISEYYHISCISVRQAGDGVVLSMAGTVVLGNGEGIQARRAGGERREARGSVRELASLPL